MHKTQRLAKEEEISEMRVKNRVTPPIEKEPVKPIPPPAPMGTIVVSSIPPGASVLIDGVEHKEPTPTVTEEVVAGEKHEIKVVKRGFEPWVEVVELEDDKSVPIEVPLKRLLTTIVIKSIPSGASVLIDGVEHKEPTPTVIEEVVAGEKHEIKVVKRGFEAWAEVVEPEDDNPLSIEVPLKRLVGTIVVKSTPPGASVFLDNSKKSSGSTPIEVPDVPVDDAHKIAVMKKGYATAVQTVRLKPGERKQVEVALKSLLGEIRITSDPPGAKVYLDERYMDRDTPTSLSDLSLGKRYKLRLVKKGYKVWEDEVSLTDPKPLDLPRVTLQQAFGSLNLLAIPWADVYHRGEKLGTTPLGNIRLPEGIQKLVLKNPLLKIEKQITVQIVADKVTKKSLDIREK
jgi:hypothetical protein